MPAKQTLFISHATHEDDYQAGWLASRLERMGYSVFVDFEDIRVGDTFFTSIQPQIQERANKFIALNTQHYVRKAKDPNSGVRRELNAGSTIRDDLNFFVPVRFDQTKFEEFPMEYVGRKVIDFHNRWGEGWLELLSELELLKVPRRGASDDPLQLWHRAIQAKGKTISGSETIHTNWFEIDLPGSLQMFRPGQITDTNLTQIPSTVIKESDRYLTFASGNTLRSILTMQSLDEIPIESMRSQSEFTASDGFVLHRPLDKLKSLLNKMFKFHCRSKGLLVYRQSGSKEVFYFIFKNRPSPFVSLNHIGRTRILLSGNKWGTNWHLALSGSAALFPFPHYKVFYHLVFSNSDYELLDTRSQHSLRRKFSPSLYNKRAYEFTLGAMKHLSDADSQRIPMRIDRDKFMYVNRVPFALSSTISYLEPDAELEDNLS